MGTIKNQKDKVLGTAKEKLGEILNKEELKDEGRAQTEAAEEKAAQYQARIDELEDQQAEKEAKTQDLTQERKKDQPDRSKTPLPEDEHIPDQQKIEEQRMKHYTGIEEKL
ncbi:MULTISPECIES: CsbD family protein [unclassified Enterococcus]|uniref:CsbD family protein n=1 Tax=unclassified Enterococcus TaxID=2608891 RepID=UPI0013EA3951|nr:MULTISPECIES: CsbD family protein [unclassified Enterococcus]